MDRDLRNCLDDDARTRTGTKGGDKVHPPPMGGPGDGGQSRLKGGTRVHRTGVAHRSKVKGHHGRGGTGGTRVRGPHHTPVFRSTEWGGEQKGTGVTQVKVGSGEDGGGKGETRVPPPPKTEGGGKGDGGRPQVKEGTWGPSRRNGGERRGRGSTATTDGGGKGDGGHPQAHRLTGGQGSTTEWGGPPKGRGRDKGDRGGHPQVTITEWGDTGGTRVDH